MSNYNGYFNYSQLSDFHDRVSEMQYDDFIKKCAKELAARLLSKVIRRTPVGVYPSGSGKTGGTLRRGWTNGRDSSPSSFANGLNVIHNANGYTIEIINPTEYASYVEYGHRTRDGAGWVEGQFMMTISENELKSIAPALLSRKIENFLRSVF